MNRGDQQSADFPPDEHPSGGAQESRPETKNNGGPPDPTLLEAALRGDIEAFAGLSEHYRPSLHALCLKQLGDRSLAEDVVQEVFIKAFGNLSKFDRSKSFWPWLSTIAFRLCIDVQRRRSFTYYSGDIGFSMDANEGNGTPSKEAGSALDAVIASEERAEFWESLKVLTKSQRKAFVLYAVDGWSCADIASAEGISVDAVKHLLFRARRKMRAARQSGLPALVAFPCTWLRSRFQEAEERLRLFLGAFGDRLSGAGTTAALLSILAVIAITVSSIEPFEVGAPIRSDETVVSETQPLLLETASPHTGASVKAPVEPQQSVVKAAGFLPDDVINPNQSATPETTILQSLTPSPSYESDHTIVGAGIFKENRVLFVSHDGGASWKPQPSRLLQGTNVVIPPGYPQDQRIFAFGNLGLQQSDDGGEIFRTVSPVVGWGLAISPSFGRGDSRILMGARTMFEYDADAGVTQPVLLSILPSRGKGSYPFVTFSPGTSSDSIVFVSDDYGGTLLNPRYDQTVFYRCKESVCDEMQLPFRGPLRLRLSPRFDQDGLAFAFTGSRILTSSDGGQTFLDLQFPLPEGRSIQDVDVMWNTSSDPAIFVSTYGFVPSMPSVFSSMDSGISWSGTSIELPGFDPGTLKLIVTPTGRLLATGGLYGIACSVDLGETWVPRCTPEL